MVQLRLTPLVAMLALVLSACAAGPSAAPTTPTELVCTEAFCLEVPSGWEGEADAAFVTLNHEAYPEGTFLTANIVDTEAIVTAAGGSWPVPPVEVVEAFWSLLEEVGEGELVRYERMIGGAIRSWGSHTTGDMWFLLVPIEGSRAIGVEMRGPNDSWESHADAVFPTVAPIG